MPQYLIKAKARKDRNSIAGVATSGETDRGYDMAAGWATALPAAMLSLATQAPAVCHPL